MGVERGPWGIGWAMLRREGRTVLLRGIGRGKPDVMHSPDRKSVARALAQWHLETAADIERVFVFERDDALPGDPIRLLEVNAATVATGRVEAFVFSPTREVPYPTQIAEITPEEFEKMRRDPSQIEGAEAWSLADAIEIRRPIAA